MRPFRSFLLLLILLICFAGLSYILPWDTALPSIESLIPKELLSKFQKNNTEGIIPPQIVPPDSSISSALSKIIQTDSGKVDKITVSKGPVEIFLDSLKYAGRQSRILYYGDSQIEGDRISSYLRSYLRKDHGGTGPGLFLPLMTVPNTRSIYVRASSNWVRYNYLSFRNGDINHNDLGPFMAFCRFLPDNQTSPIKTKAWIRIIPSTTADKSASTFENLRILYRNNAGKVVINVKADENRLITDTLRTSSGIAEFRSPVFNSRDVLIEFSGTTSPDIYGISLESNSGVIVDNIPQRGSAGLEFTMVDRKNLADSYKLLSPGLIILHYGLNLAPNIREDYTYYEKGLLRQVSLLKQVAPGAGIVIIGLTDMAYAEGDEVKSYPNIQKIIAAQKRAADQSGALFWDAYKAMGGNSSIIKWFNLNPPLAKKDYVHFTDQGADTLAKIMVSELFKTNQPEKHIAESPAIMQDTAKVLKPETTSPSPEAKAKESTVKSVINEIFSYNQDKPFIFSSTAFWLFFLFVLAGFSLVYKKLFMRNLYLFLISLFFYYKTGGLFLFILIFVTFIDYAVGLLISGSGNKYKRRFFVILSVLSNLGLLAYFKYTGFIVTTINRLFGTDLHVFDMLSALSNSVLGTSFDISYIILPAGISFFTFQSLSYTIDVYRRKMEPVRNIIDFGFYVSFFPHLVAGPIVRASVFIPQIYQEFNLTKREFSHALFMISKGLIKKILISNFIAVNLVDRVFDIPSGFSGFENLLAVYGYGLQIYCDFSGYTDIAIGVALILGFRLPVNFNSPYKAINISDFWKRWHISLSQWLRDYLYISLGGNRKGKLRTIMNLMITMLLGGLWHGANLRFLIWGGLHGAGLALNKIRSFIFGERVSKKRVVRAVSIFLTFQFVSFCWIFFRSTDLDKALLMIRQIFKNFLPDSFANLVPVYSGVLSIILAGYLVHFLPEKLKESYRGLFIKIPLAVQMVVILVIAFMLYQMRTTEIMPFIYFRF